MVNTDMATITIDGQPISVPKGENLIESAKRLGINIPHYCYHPKLSVAGNCRMCMVEVEKMPKLTIACNTGAQEGMVVHTKSKKTVSAQKMVMEFLLINHPLDCPFCDQAGECKLQDYYMAHGMNGSHFKEEKLHKEKAKRIGQHVVLDQERCINCTRCVRFMNEIAKDPVLGQFERNNRAHFTKSLCKNDY